MTDDIVQIPIGPDLFAAQLAAEACRAEGLRVELLGGESGAHPTSTGMEQVLLVRGEDLAQAREILSRGGVL